MKPFRPLTAGITILLSIVVCCAAQTPQLSISEIVSIAREAAAAEPVEEKIVPILSLEPSLSGTFWGLQRDLPPLPFLPFPELETIEIGPGVFLFDDRAVDYEAVHRLRTLTLSLQTLEGEYGLESQEMTTLSDEVPELPGDGEPGDGEWEPPPMLEAYAYPSNVMHLYISCVSNGWALVDIRNTSSENTYELLSSESLTAPVSAWFSEGYVPGLDGVTPTMVPMRYATNMFLSARDVALDSSGQGIPDFWLLTWFGTTDVDIWADPDGDGWSNFEEFLNGTSPFSFNKPPPPYSVTATVGSTGTNVLVSWKYGGGPVDHYEVVEDGWNPKGQVGPEIFQAWIETRFTYLDHTLVDERRFTVRAYFSDGSFSDSTPTVASRNSLNVDVQVVRGPFGGFCLAIPAIPEELAVARIGTVYWDGNEVVIAGSFELHKSRFESGIAILADEEWRPSFDLCDIISVQLISPNEERGFAKA